LEQHEADALFSKTLATIDRRVPISVSLGGARWKKALARNRLRDAFSRFGFESLIRRLDGGAPVSGAARAAGEHRPAPLVTGPLKVRSAASWPAPKERAVILLEAANKKLFVATSSDEVFELPSAAIQGASAERWFNSGTPIYTYDAKLLYRSRLSPTVSPPRDLMLAWWLLEPGRRDYPAELLIAKEVGQAPTSPAELARQLFLVAPSLEARLKAEELDRPFTELELPLPPILARMEEIGIGFDPRPLAKLSKI
jgi:hypothetical protein